MSNPRPRGSNVLSANWVLLHWKTWGSDAIRKPSTRFRDSLTLRCRQPSQRHMGKQGVHRPDLPTCFTLSKQTAFFTPRFKLRGWIFLVDFFSKSILPDRIPPRYAIFTAYFIKPHFFTLCGAYCACGIRHAAKQQKLLPQTSWVEGV